MTLTKCLPVLVSGRPSEVMLNLRKWLATLLLPACLFFPFVTSAQEETVHNISLSKAASEAVRSNFDIAIERVRLKTASEKRVIAESEFDPVLGSEVLTEKNRIANTSAFASPEVGETDTVSGKVSVSRKSSIGTEYSVSVNTARDFTNSEFQGLNPSYSGNLNLEVTQPLLKGAGADVNKWRIYTSLNNEEIARRQLQIKLSEVLTSVHETYWELLFLVENLKAVQEALDRAIDHETRIRVQVDVGSMPPIEIVQAQAFVAANEEDVIEAENLLAHMSDQLLKLITPHVYDTGMWNVRLNPVDYPDMVFPSINLEDSIAMALEKRPEVALLKKEIENKNIELVYLKNQKWPSLDLVATITHNGVRGRARGVKSFSTGEEAKSSFSGDYGDVFSDVGSGKYYNYLVGLKFSYPFGARAGRASEAVAVYEAEEIVLRLKALERDIVLEVRDAVREIESGKKRVKAARYARTLAEKKLSAEMKKFEVGASTSFNVLEFQKDLTAQRTDELRVLAETRKAMARYQKAVGATLEYNGMEFAE